MTSTPRPATVASRPGRRTSATTLGGVLLVCAIALSLGLGAGDVGPARAIEVLALGGDADARNTVLELRVPRTVVGVLVGSALAVAGLVLQAAARNPLAEPGLLGVSAGASFAVVVSIALGGSVATLQTPVAVLGALAGCMLALGAARLQGVGSDPIRLVLAGAALSALLGAATSVILMLDQRTADEIRFWVTGAIAGRDMSTVTTALPVVLAGLALSAVVARGLAALMLGEQAARSLGHRPRLLRGAAMVAVALLVGAATAAAGPIAFVGLVAPFAARALVGPDPRKALLVCLLLGPAILLGADVVSRLLVRPYEMPLGVVTAFIGAPILVAVVRARRIPSL